MLSKARVNIRAGVLAAVAVVLGVALLVTATLLEDHAGAPKWVTTPLREMGALLFVTSVLTLAWDIRGKRILADEVLAAAGVAAEVRQAGLLHVTDSYLDGVEWKKLLSNSREVDLFFSYASTWRNAHATEMRSLVLSQGATLRVILPDPGDRALMADLASRYGYEQAAMVDRVRDAINDFQGLKQAAKNGSTVEVRFTTRAPVFSYYRFDKTTVSALYAQVLGRVPVPTFVSERGGRLSEFFDQQFVSLWESAQLSVTPPPAASASSAAG